MISRRACCFVLLFLSAVGALFLNEWRSSTIRMNFVEEKAFANPMSDAGLGVLGQLAASGRPEFAPAPAAPAPRPRAAPRPAPRPPPPPPKPCTIDCLPECPMSARPWAPCVRPAEVWPYKTKTAWRTDLGERVLKAITPQIVEADCNGYELFGDHVFCLGAMKRKDALALSYGIEERDMWSEKMSNRFRLSTRLYDCFINPRQSPPISGRAPNGTGAGSCANVGGPCYEQPYEAYRICFGPRKETKDRRKYETLHDHLEGRGRLSTYVKIDTEGSEWTVLERLLEDSEDQDKIRTLDMEVHFDMRTHSDEGHEESRRSLREALEAQVRVIERLNERFRVTGSTLEVYAQGWRPRDHCPKNDCEEPKIHLRGGFNVEQFAVSFVHRDMFPPGVAARTALAGTGSGDEPVFPEPAPAPAPPPPPPPPSEESAASSDDDDVIERPCEKVFNGKSSRPGRPCLPPASRYPFRQNTPWRAELGRRIWRSVVGQVTDEDCGGFELFGDSTWCMRAMRGKDVLGLSYGIEQRDLWSEKMSNVFRMPTRLYDCFIPPKLSPTISGSAPNNTGKDGCKSEPGHCYESRYEAYRICLGSEAQNLNGRKYETLLGHLEERGPLSTHVKIDTEGTEWAVLETLLESPYDQEKIRTLEMEVHFSFMPEALPSEMRQMPQRQRIERAVRVMERLQEHFVVTGSTLEVYREDWNPEKMCPDASCDEPPVHIPSMQVDQFAVSYVHRGLLDPNFVVKKPVQAPGPAPAPKDEDEEEEDPPAPAPAPPPQHEDEQDQDRQKLPTPVGPDCEYECLPSCPASARPGKPCIPPAKVWPYSTHDAWRSELGERILKAVVGDVSEKECGGFILFGDHVFCKKAMKLKKAVALSYGIEERDMYSEKMSNLFHIPTRLYDCFQNPRTSPPISGKAPNNTGRGGCAHTDQHCYEKPYQPFRICLGPRKGRIEGRRYETLRDHLSDRGPLSTYVKIDTEGSEWTVLDRLLDRPEDIAKIRTLDMEVHFGFGAASDEGQGRGGVKSALEWEVRIMERLQEHFRVLGSTLENYRQGWRPEQDCAQSQCNEPVVHSAGGFGLPQFAVGYVNKNLL